MTVLTNKAADVATAHVAVGALALATGSFLSIVSFRLSATEPTGVATSARLNGDAAMFSSASTGAGHLR
jgi:hypothetical protein